VLRAAQDVLREFDQEQIHKAMLGLSWGFPAHGLGPGQLPVYLLGSPAENDSKLNLYIQKNHHNFELGTFLRYLHKYDSGPTTLHQV
jgi:hypothetical protein